MRYLIKWKDGTYGHRHPIKVIINPILRWLQFFSDSPWVIQSKFEIEAGIPKRFIKFCFKKAKYKTLSIKWRN
jgi:hypothetical protein